MFELKHEKEQCQRIIKAYITFEHEFGYDECLKCSASTGLFSNIKNILNNKNHSILGVVPIFRTAVEPANIKWDHLEIRGRQFTGRLAVVFLILFIMLILQVTGSV